MRFNVYSKVFPNNFDEDKYKDMISKIINLKTLNDDDYEYIKKLEKEHLIEIIKLLNKNMNYMNEYISSVNV